MTEDDTFNALKRIPFEDARNMCIEVCSKKNISGGNIRFWDNNYAEQTGWTFADMITHMSKRTSIIEIIRHNKDCHLKT
jgi:hypothetical protein